MVQRRNRMWYSTPMYNFLLNDTVQHKYLPILSDPTEEDSDGDELLDGQEQYLATQDFTMPKDPEPLKFTYFPKFGTEEYIQNTEQKYEGVEHQIKHMMSTVDRCKYTDLVDDENWLKFCEYFNTCVETYGSIYEELHYFRMKLNRTPESFAELVNNKENWRIYTKDNTRYHENNCRLSEEAFNNSKISDSIDYATYKSYFSETQYISTNEAYPSYSTYGNEYNMKFVDKYGMNEVVVTPDTDLSQMSDDEIKNYLKDESHWQILTADYNKAQNDPNFKYDPVNVGTYNYCGYEEGIEFVYSYDETKVKNSSSDDHQKYDVKPYLGGKKSYSNWGNVPGLIYGNTRSQRDKNGYYHRDICVVNNHDVIYEEWECEFER